MDAARISDRLSSTGKVEIEPFFKTLAKHNLSLSRDRTTTLQINLGRMCNQYCRHCHLDAGPNRKEIMASQTMDQIVGYAEKVPFDMIDVTGGAPEIHPQLEPFIEQLSKHTPYLILRSNLTLLAQNNDALISFFKSKRVHLTVSFPSLNESQAEGIRGKGSFLKSINALQRLNSFGYGHPDSGLELNLVVNPSGAFLPPSQNELEKRFKTILQRKYGIHFSRLYSFANVPLGRYRDWLIKTGNYEMYLKKLTRAFNPNAVSGLMCRSLISISWDGYLFDCDFHQAAGIYAGKAKTHISTMSATPACGSAINCADHCYTCTAGDGFT